MRLSETWFMEGYIDFELQKYRLLAYLKEVEQCFNATKLYPQLSDIILHYNNLATFRDNKKMMQDSFPKMADKVNLRRLELVYKQMTQDDELMQELERITQYALDEMKTTIDNGTEIYEHVEKQLHIEPVGILPLYKNEGYMLLRYGQHTDIQAYAYTITIFEQPDARYKGLRVEYLDRWAANITNTYSQVKKDIIRINRTLPNPAVYCIESSMTLPLAETLLPIAKRMLVKHIGEA
jgi:hypothetical protein